MKKALIFVMTILLNFNGFSQIEIGKAVLDYSILSNGETLKMNGAGERSLLFAELYSAALYLQKKSNDALEVCFADENMLFRIVVTSRAFDREMFVESITEDLDRATDYNMSPLQSRFDQFIELLSDPIVKNDVIDFAYEKGVGTHFIKNDKELGVIKGQDFKFALYKIWLGQEPVDDKLKNELMDNS